jgi:hypothetical protein
MFAKTPEEICDLFRNHMGAGDLDSVMTLYDPGVVFLNAAGDEKRGERGWLIGDPYSYSRFDSSGQP